MYPNNNNMYTDAYQQYLYNQLNQLQRQQQMQNMQYPQNQTQPTQSPIRDIKFVTSEEAKAYIVFPNTSILLIDKQQQKAYLKTADQMGQSVMKEYSYKTIDNSKPSVSEPNTDTKDGAVDKSPNYITKDDLQGYNFATKEDVEVLSMKMDKLFLKPMQQPKPTTKAVTNNE